MKVQLQKLLELLAQANAGVKAVLVTGLAAIFVIVTFSAYRANNPSFRQLYSQLQANESAAVQNALAGAGIRYEASQPPGPFVIHVEESKYYEAQNAVALSGALAATPSGIQVGGGSDVFQGADERRQSMRKRGWQEMEKQLEVLDFIVKASVTTSAPKTMLGRKPPPPTVAVMLQVLGGLEPSRGQADTVARLVRHRFNVPASNVVISDQRGVSLYDGSDEADNGVDSGGLLDHKDRYDDDLTERANSALDRAFGGGLAYVTLNSDWHWEDHETVTQRYDPKGVVVQQTTLNSETPQGGSSFSAEGGSPGVSSNLAGSSTTGAAGSTGVAEAPVATTSEETKQSLVGMETSLKRSRTPVLDRLSISLWLDESLEQDRASIESNVKSAVGFDEARGDLFSSHMSAIAAVPRDVDGNLIPAEPPVPVEEPSVMMELLLEHGIEALAALAFLFVLFKTLKGAGKDAKSSAPATDKADQDLAGLELLAKSQIEELVRTDPERVSTILSTWANQETAARS